MSYTIQGFILRESSFPSIQAMLPYKNICLATLKEGMLLIPLTDELYDEIHVCAVNDIEGFDCLTDTLLELLSELSREMDIGYIEAEYFGGTGYQNGLLYRNSAMTLQYVQEQDAINKVLLGLGVVKAEPQDEFATVGLDKHRSNEGWAQKQ